MRKQRWKLAIADAKKPPKRQKGKGKTKTKNGGKLICFAFNNGLKCRNDPCTYDHICQVCGGKHPKIDPSRPGRSFPPPEVTPSPTPQ